MRRPAFQAGEARFNSGTRDQHQGHQLDWTERPATDREVRGSNPLWPANSGPALWTALPPSKRNAEGSNPSGVTTTRPQHDGPCTRPRTGRLEVRPLPGARQCARLAQPAEALRSKRRCSGFESPAAYQRGGIIQWQNSGPLNRPSWVRFPVPPPSAGVAQSVVQSLRKRKVVGLTPAASTTHRGRRNAGSSASQRGQ